MPRNQTAAKEAKYGQKMIEVKVRFWTDQIAKKKDKVIPKHAWAAGTVRIKRNDAHGIGPSSPIPFNSLLDLGLSIVKVLIAHGVILHPGRKMKKYIFKK
jgi:hypothetical protein